MDLSTLIGILLALGGLIAGYLYEGKFDFSLLHKLYQPSAVLIILCGTIGSVVASFPLSETKKVPSLVKSIFTNKFYNEIEIINQMADLSEKARRDGLLSLEYEAQSNKNELIKKGLSLVVDGIETEVIKDILRREVMLRESIYETGARIFEAAGGFAPTMGVLGTVMGMINILGSLDNSEELAASIGVAFIATLYGVATANIFWIPFANKIKYNAEKETMVNDMIIEGLLSIQAGENPRIIKEKLNFTLLQKMNKQPNIEAVEVIT